MQNIPSTRTLQHLAYVTGKKPRLLFSATLQERNCLVIAIEMPDSRQSSKEGYGPCRLMHALGSTATFYTLQLTAANLGLQYPVQQMQWDWQLDTAMDLKFRSIIKSSNPSVSNSLQTPQTHPPHHHPISPAVSIINFQLIKTSSENASNLFWRLNQDQAVLVPG